MVLLPPCPTTTSWELSAQNLKISTRCFFHTSKHRCKKRCSAGQRAHVSPCKVKARGSHRGQQGQRQRLALLSFPRPQSKQLLVAHCERVARGGRCCITNGRIENSSARYQFSVSQRRFLLLASSSPSDSVRRDIVEAEGKTLPLWVRQAERRSESKQSKRGAWLTLSSIPDSTTVTNLSEEFFLSQRASIRKSGRAVVGDSCVLHHQLPVVPLQRYEQERLQHWFIEEINRLSLGLLQ